MVTADTSAAPLETPAEPTHYAVGRNRFRIAGDTVRTAIADLPEDQKSTVWWFAQWIGRNITTKADLGSVLKKDSGSFYSDDSIIQLLTGGRIRRGENIAPMLDAIGKLRAVEDLRADQVTSGFIHTRLYTEISRRCQKALKRQRIQFIFGDSQIGKSTCLKEYARTHNHGETAYWEMPALGSLGGLLREAAAFFNIPSVLNQGQLQDRIIDCIDPNMLIILDEFHNCLLGRSTAAASFVREIWNRKRCGFVISMTNEGKKSLLEGKQCKALEQLWRRRITPLQLPSVPPDDDAALFAKAYGLTPATDDPVSVKITWLDERGHNRSREYSASPLALQRKVLMDEGLGVWIGILQDAADMAQEQRRPITWGAVIKASCQAQAEADIFI